MFEMEWRNGRLQQKRDHTGFLLRLLFGAALGQRPDDFADQEMAIMKRRHNLPNNGVNPTPTVPQAGEGWHIARKSAGKEIEMKTDIKGCSTTAKGVEQWEEYTSAISGREMVQYDYRTLEGRCFSCVAPSVEVARTRRDAWLRREGSARGSKNQQAGGGPANKERRLRNAVTDTIERNPGANFAGKSRKRCGRFGCDAKWQGAIYPDAPQLHTR
ncbi:MAG: DUF3873 family protein [Chloroflexota bacterium]